MSPSYEEKYRLALAELDHSDLVKRNALPPGHRIARWLGAEARPPHYNSFLRNATSPGLAFALGWGLSMWAWKGFPLDDSRVIGLMIASAGAGIAFGLVHAMSCRRSAAKNQLSIWEELGTPK